jgi:type I restriction enzyme S subunit
LPKGQAAAPPGGCFKLPIGWVWTKLQAVCTSITDGDHLPPPKAEAGVPFLVISDVRTKVINYSPERHVPRSYYEALDPIRRPTRGDVLYTLVGSFGIPIEVTDDREFCVQRHIGILRPARCVTASFVARLLESTFVFRQASACATGIAQKTIPLSGLRRLLIPLPPLPEQRRIVAKVDALMALCDRLEASLTATAATRRRLLDALLAEALTPADDRELEAAE